MTATLAISGSLQKFSEWCTTTQTIMYCEHFGEPDTKVPCIRTILIEGSNSQSQAYHMQRHPRQVLRPPGAAPQAQWEVHI